MQMLRKSLYDDAYTKIKHYGYREQVEQNLLEDDNLDKNIQEGIESNQGISTSLFEDDDIQLEVTNTKLDYVPSHDNLQCAYDDLNDSLLNLKNRNLVSIQSICFIENQIESLKNIYDFQEEDIPLNCESSTILKNCIDVDNQVEELSSKLSIIDNLTCSYSMFENENNNDIFVHEKPRNDCGNNSLDNDNSKKTKNLKVELEKNKLSCKYIKIIMPSLSLSGEGWSINVYSYDDRMKFYIVVENQGAAAIFYAESVETYTYRLD
ncbi:uncharacterized protein LOC133308853 [Gastrolobium bilobum]|uniref:uncharacterized protein LOC133308853 n=1 Tax=Gastrolobium bilobum TaxID=150636 RepID=UPI002AB0AD07|nr:uncharacterized protein LOC133308853 [Gastrolobium bilobum]